MIRGGGITKRGAKSFRPALRLSFVSCGFAASRHPRPALARLPAAQPAHKEPRAPRIQFFRTPEQKITLFSRG